MEPARLRLGQLLVDARIIPQEQLEAVLHAQKDDGRRLGTLLVERGLVNETQLTQILSQQLSVPWVSLYHIDFSRRLLNLVPAEVAQKYCLVPIYVRKVRGQGDTLYVAMDDPTNEEALRECAAWSGLPTRAMIASPSDISHAVEVYYGIAREKTAPASEPAGEPVGEEPVGEEPVGEEPVGEENAPVEAQHPDQPDDSTSESPPDSKPQAAEQSQAADKPESIPATMPAVCDEPEPDESPARPLMQSEADIHVDFSDTEQPPAVAETSQTSEESRDDQSVSVELGESIPLADVLAEHRPAASLESNTVLPKRKGFAFTLLDGTSLPLPSHRAAVKKKRRQPLASVVREESDTSNEAEDASTPSSRPRVDPSEFHAAGQDAALTARDVISALRAASHGVDPVDILGQSARWEALFSALLSLLLQRGVIDDDEFIDELKRI